MWLLPVFSPLARLLVHGFYRLSVDGGRVPSTGPALLLANHPNALLDPAMVVAVAGRPVRFLAKAPLFSDPLLGWIIRGSGSLPVFRQQDDPAAMGQNQDTFRAVHQALAGGSAVGIFPEGISHSDPAMVPLKTGAARMALRAAALRGERAFPLIPIGLSLREKETFRTEAVAIVGVPVAWDDLAAAGDGDADVVRALTQRIEAALHDVTVNVDAWEDAPLVAAAEEIWAAECGASAAPGPRVERQATVAERLSALRHEGDARWEPLAREVRQHARTLRVLGMRPNELREDADPRVAAEWVARQLAFFGLGAPLAVLGTVLFYLPYRLVGFVEAKARPTRDARATYKLLIGLVIGVVWTLLLAGFAGWRVGWMAGLAALVVLPVLARVTVHVLDRWARATGELRRFLLRTRRRAALAEVRERQRRLAARLDALWESVRA